jgi:hypothetical protein
MPNNYQVEDVKPNNAEVVDATTTYYDNRFVQVGQSMGLLLTLTFPVAGTYTNAQRL